jgi:S1-C subfamily serine protease
MGMFKSGRSMGPLSMRTRWLALLTVAVVAVVVIGVLVSACGGTLGSTNTSNAQSTAATTGVTTAGVPTTQAPPNPQAPSTVSTTPLPPASPGEASPAQSVATILGPSVVNLKVTGTTTSGGNGFGQFGQQQQQYSAEGSGVIYRADGYIITNNHVVSDETTGDPVSTIKVTFATGEQLDATIVGRDPLSDLAVIKVQPKGDLPVAKFVAGTPKVGEYAIAIGSPLGYENSVTLGIVSGLGRSIEGVTGAEGVALTNLVQTDAPISPGNSGGALANSNGEVIGINVAYLPPGSTGAVNIGFAIPSTTAVSVADQIISTGKATHAYMGVGTQPITPELQKQYGLSRSSGLLIAEVAASSPAAAAGLQQGDIILKVNGQDITDSTALVTLVRGMKPGDQVQLTIDRNGQEQTVTVTLADRPASF